METSSSTLMSSDLISSYEEDQFTTTTTIPGEKPFDFGLLFRGVIVTMGIVGIIGNGLVLGALAASKQLKKELFNVLFGGAKAGRLIPCVDKTVGGSQRRGVSCLPYFTTASSKQLKKELFNVLFEHPHFPYHHLRRRWTTMSSDVTATVLHDQSKDQDRPEMVSRRLETKIMTRTRG